MNAAATVRCRIKVNNILKLREFNELLGKFQPLIQTAGILILIIGSVLAYFQVKLNLLEFEVENKRLLLELDPRWRIEFHKDQINALVDNIEFTSLNPAYNIQSVQILLLHNLSPYRFVSSSNILVTKDLKDRVEMVYKATYDLNGDDCYPCTENNSYPLAIRFHFEKFGVRGDTTILYNYHFTIYHTRTKLKIKSNSIEFIKYLPTDSASINRELIAYNLNYSFLSNITQARSQIKILIGLRDSTYRPIFQYAFSNLKSYQTSFQVLDNKKKTLLELVLQMPLPLVDSAAIRNRHRIINNINRNLDNYDSTLISTVLKIQAFEETFRKSESTIPIDSLSIMPKRFLNDKSWSRWQEMNYELINLAATRISI